MIARTPVHSSKIEREREREQAPTNERGTERRSIFPRTFQPLEYGQPAHMSNTLGPNY